MRRNICSYAALCELPLAIVSSNLVEEGRLATTIICFINQKGGCGKSSCTFHLGGEFAKSGRRVLLVDADPQGSLSQGFFGPARVEVMPMHDTLAGIFGADVQPSTVRRLTQPSGFERLDIICANQTLAPYNFPSPEKSGFAQFELSQLLDDAKELDLVLIDCPPNLYQCSWNALISADYVVIPVPPEDFGTQGLRVVQQAIEHARQLNPRLKLLGHLVTRSDSRLLVHQSYEQRLRTIYGASVLRTVIPEAVAFKMSLAQRTPVTFAYPDTKAAEAITALRCELAQRMSEPKQLRQVA